ncbi:MAG: hypothetical protein JKP90_23305 [Desulfofustis sp. PB-SRB1]|jgi:diphthamide synthase subunit DPH2|nr:hypothetical protein [Desulfofustis sp. PB-SRB1]MBL0382472.1 hypothetical protein [Desulfofustis sp. PB-SRB1]
MNTDIEKEVKHTEKLLKGKTVKTVWRHREKEVGIEFTDGTRLFVDHNEHGLELSITSGSDRS